MATATHILDSLHETLMHEVGHANRNLEDWATKMLKNPAHEFEWGSGAIKCAARVEVYGEIITGIERMDPADDADEQLALVKQTILTEALRGAESPAESTSPISNLTDRYRTMAWAEVARKLGRG